MEQSDIKELVELLEKALRLECWETVEETLIYMKEYLDENLSDGYLEE